MMQIFNVVMLLCQMMLMSSYADLLSDLLHVMEDMTSLSDTRRTIRYKFDPQAKMTTLEIIHYNGYPAERHEVVTKDGYILELHRIPRGRYNITNSARRPMLIQHGILTSSSSWVFNGVKDSAGFIFADEGYDVWLSNIRGNTYSRRHIRISPTESKFWEFSLDDHATEDLPAMIDYILEVTKREKLIYMGHSLGGTIGTMLVAGRPEYNKKIDLAILLAPVLHGKFLRNPLKLIQYHFPEANEWFSIFPTKELLPKNDLLNKFTQSACSFYPGVIFCEFFLFLLSGYHEALLDRSRLHVIASHGMCGSSWKIIEHYVQLGNAEIVQKFDYGPQGNLKHYGTVKPPEYNLSEISAPTAVFWGYMDLFLDQNHMDKLARQLPNLKVIEKVAVDLWTHTDFITATDAKFHFYDRVLRLLKELL